MSEDVYTRLREFMDTLPGGYPATPSGVEIKLLKKLFTPEQAELTMKLGQEPEEVQSIAARTGIDETELAEKLEELALKGCIFRVRDGEKRLYQAYQFVVGVYEFQLNNLDREFAELFEEYLPHIGLSMAQVKTSQMRVIPLESAVEATPAVETYNRIRDLVRQQEIISVEPCICRKEQGLLGNECEKPKEVCIGFGDFARFYIDNGMGRQISVDEALEGPRHRGGGGPGGLSHQLPEDRGDLLLLFVLLSDPQVREDRASARRHGHLLLRGQARRRGVHGLRAVRRQVPDGCDRRGRRRLGNRRRPVHRLRSLRRGVSDGGHLDGGKAGYRAASCDLRRHAAQNRSRARSVVGPGATRRDVIDIIPREMRRESQLIRAATASRRHPRLVESQALPFGIPSDPDAESACSRRRSDVECDL